MNTKLFTNCILMFTALILLLGCFSKEKIEKEPYGSESKLVLLKEERSVLNTQNKENSKEERKTTHTTVGVFSKDTIKVYTYTGGKVEEEHPEMFILKDNGNKNQKILVYHKNKDDKTIKDSLLISFGEDNSVSVDRNKFYLNDAYYKHLKNKILKEKSVYPLVGLIKDNFGGYYSQYKVLFKNWFPTQENPEFKILRAESQIKRDPKAEYVYTGQVQYDYYKDDLTEVKLMSGGVTFEKRLIAKNKVYKVYSVKNTNNQTFEDSKVYYNKIKKHDSVSTIQVQYPQNIITNISYYPVSREVYPLKKTNMNSSEITTIIANHL